MQDVLVLVGIIIGGPLFLAVFAMCLYPEAIFLIFAMREIRKMAALLPEKDRERWMDDQGRGMAEAKEAKKRAA